jgi:hypothetical protein
MTAIEGIVEVLLMVDQGERGLHAVPEPVSIPGHLGPARPRIRCLGFRPLPVGHRLDSRLRHLLVRPRGGKDEGRRAVYGAGSKGAPATLPLFSQDPRKSEARSDVASPAAQVENTICRLLA